MTDTTVQARTPSTMRVAGSTTRLVLKRRTEFAVGWASIDDEVEQLIDAKFEADKAEHKAWLMSQLGA